MIDQRIPSPRLRRQAERIHDLGPLPLAHLLAALAAGADVLDEIEAYARMPAAFIAAYGADCDRTEFVLLRGGRSA